MAQVATNVLGFAGWRGAALAAVENPDPVVAPGQFLLPLPAGELAGSTEHP